MSQTSQAITRVEVGDITPPEAPIVDLIVSSDSGESDSDNVTNDDTPTLEITAEAGSTVKLLQDGTEIADVIADNEGRAEFTLDSLVDGTYEFTATATDAAGNTSDLSESLSVAIDTTAPDTPTLELDPAFDSEPLGDGETTFALVSFEGITTPNVSVELLETSQTTTSNNEGEFVFTDVSLELGENDFTVVTTDLAGNQSQFIQTITRRELVEDITAPIIATSLINDTGTDNTDNLTSAPSITGTITDESAITSFRAGLDEVSVRDFVDVSDSLQQDGSFSLDASELRRINGNVDLAEGEHTLQLIATDAAGNTTEIFSTTFILDTISPTANLEGNLPTDVMTLDVVFSELVTDAAFVPENYRLTGSDANEVSTSVEITAVENVDGIARLILAESLSSTISYSLSLDSVIQDLAGNALPANTSLDFSVAPPTVEVSPVDGEEQVGLTREIVIDFTTGIDATTVTSETIQVIALGEQLSGRLEVGSTARSVRFFPDNPLPASTEIRIQVNGDQIRALDGAIIDADSDGSSGGTLTVDFRTVSSTRIENTNVFGRIFDSNNVNPDGSNIPIEGIRVEVVGLPEVFAVTDENGFFQLDNLPAPEFFVTIDSTNASSSALTSEGEFYVSIEEKFESIPGETIQLQQDGRSLDIFLPIVSEDDFTEISTEEETTVGLGEQALEILTEMFPDVPVETLERLEVTIQPDSLSFDDGTPVTEVAIIPLPTDRVPSPPPEGLNPSFIFTVEARGARNIDNTASIVYPNIDGLAPGERRFIYAFDHDAGEWITTGTATVSEDGTALVSDQDSGVQTLGWRFVAPDPISPTDGPEDPPCFDTGDIFEIVVDAGQAAANCAQNLLQIRESIRDIFNLASQIRGLVNSARNLYNDIQNGNITTAGGVANALATLNSAKGTVLASIDLVRRNNPISRALAISRCIGDALNFAESVCNRLNRPDSPCGGPIVRGICVGLAAASSTLDKVNNLIGQAEGGLRGLSVALLCGTIDQIGSILGAAGSPQSSLLASNLLQTQQVDPDAPIPEEVLALLQQVITEGENTTLQLESTEELASSLQDLDGEFGELKNGISQIRAEFETAPANAPYLIQYNNFEVRGVTDGAGKISANLPANTDYTITIYDPVTNSLGEVNGTTSAPGNTTQVPRFFMFPVDNTSVDTDGEMLVDRAELVLGTNPNNIDSDRDGINDFAEIQQGLDPLGGDGFPTGIIGNIPLSGDALEIFVTGSTPTPEGQTAYIATGSHGLAVVDASQFSNPIALGELDLSGISTDITVDPTSDTAILAGGTVGIHIVDVSDPMMPELLETISTPQSVNRVEFNDGLIYAASGNQLLVTDLASSEVVQKLDLGSSVNDIEQEGSTLYAVTNDNHLHVIDISNFSADVLSTIDIPTDASRVFVGNGVAYVANGRETILAVGPRPDPLAGYVTFDVSDPDNPALISGIDTPQVQSGNLKTVTNGSGLALVAGGFRGLQVHNATDNATTYDLITEIPTPGTANSVAVAGGIAFVADGSAGLQVINYRSFDALGQAPTISISSEVSDVDPNTAGIQVVEGTTIPIRADVFDDVQARNVELLVNGQTVFNDVSFPFDLSAVALIEDLSNPVIQIQARATDTGGNSTLSNLLTFDIVEDTIAPVVVGTTPEVDENTFFTPSIDIRFNEALDTSLINLSGITLTNLGPDGVLGGGDDRLIQLDSVETRNLDRRLVILPAEILDTGRHQLVVDPTVIADRAGNTLSDPFILEFNVLPASTIQAETGNAAIQRAPSANVGQVLSFQVPWQTENTRVRFSTINASGTNGTAIINPFSSSPDTQIARFIVPNEAATGDILVYGTGSSNFTGFANWTVTEGSVDLIGTDAAGTAFSDLLPGNGLYLDLDGTVGNAGRLESRATFTLAPGDYELQFDLAGSQRSFGNANNEVTVTLGDFSETFTLSNSEPFSTISRTLIITDQTNAKLIFDHAGNDNVGLLLDNVLLTQLGSGDILLEDDFELEFSTEPLPLQIVPTITNVDLTGINSSGASFSLSGTGFIEGENTLYNFGSRTAIDANNSTNFINVFSSNTRVNISSLGFSEELFDAVTVTTAGGTSAPFTFDITEVESTALIGTAADSNEASANTGQSITLRGSNLSSATDIVLRYFDNNGNVQVTVVNPSFVNADGTEASLEVPSFLNGAFELLIPGSANQPLLQVVPTISSIDITSSNQARLVGSGISEGDSSYNFVGGVLVDPDGSFNTVDVFSNGSQVNLNALPVHGFGELTVTTAAGTSNAITPNFLSAGLGDLRDIAFDGTHLWLAPRQSGQQLHQVSLTTGETLNSLDLPLALGTTTNGLGLQVLPSSLMLADINAGGSLVNVPAGSLLLSNFSFFPDRIFAIDPNNGDILATLELAVNIDPVAVVYDPGDGGHLYVLDGSPNEVVEIDPTNGARIEVGSFATPFDISTGALALDPGGDTLWIGSDRTNTIAEVQRDGRLVRTVDLSSQGLNFEITGFTFDADGHLLASSSLGVVYRLETA